MSYTKTVWEDLPSTDTPLNATNLNNIEDGLEDIDQEVEGVNQFLGVDTNTYDNTATYSVGDKVIYENKIYECNTAISTAEDFDSSKWDLVPVIDNMEINPKLNKYSTSETMIGTWIDGKPIYRRVVVYTGTKSNYVTIPHGISNFGEIINIVGKMASRILPTAYGATGTLNTSNYYAFIYLVDNTNIELSLSNYFVNQSTPLIFVLEYTKTTD